MKLLELKTTLQELGLKLFTLNDIVKITGQKKEIVKVYLHRQVKDGKLHRIKKKYYSFEELHKFQYAATYKDSYLALNSALEFYGTTTQNYRTIELISTHQLSSTSEINHQTVKQELFFGFEKVNMDGIWFFVSNLEKTLIDCTYYSNKVYVSEIREFIRQKKDELDIQRITQYLKRINSSVLNKRVGYLLSLENIELKNITINNKYEKLNKNLSTTGKKNTTWKLIINEEL